MHHSERLEGEQDALLLGSFRRGQHVLYKGSRGFVIAGFNKEAGRIIVAKENPQHDDLEPQHLLAQPEELADDHDWLRR